MEISSRSSRGIHTAHWLDWPNRNVFGDCPKRLYDKSCCLRSVGR